jgi:hypothetical protein
VSSSSGGTIATASSAKTFQMGTLVQALSTGGMTISQLFSGYPLAPNGGPSLQGNLVTISDPSAVPMPMQNSTVAVVPILLTSAPNSSSYTLVMLDPTTGLTYSVAVNMAAPAPTSGGGSTVAAAP